MLSEKFLRLSTASYNSVSSAVLLLLLIIKKTRYPLFSQIICKQTVLVYFAGCHTGSKNACQASTIHTKFVYTYGPIREKAGAGVFGFSWIICRGLIATNAAALETPDVIKRLRIIQLTLSVFHRYHQGSFCKSGKWNNINSFTVYPKRYFPHSKK